MAEIAEQVVAWVSDNAVRGIGVLVMLTVAWIVAAWVRGASRRALKAAGVDLTLAKFLSNAARWLVLLPVVLTSISLFGVQTTTFAAAVGAAGLAIALAFQGSLSNLASGVMLLTFRPFKVGDRVNAGGKVGIVDEIGLVYTTLDDDDGVRVAAPNAKVFAGLIENHSHHPKVASVIEVQLPTSRSLDEWQAFLDGLVERDAARHDAITLMSTTAKQSVWRVCTWSAEPPRRAGTSLVKRVDAALREHGADEYACKLLS